MKTPRKVLIGGLAVAISAAAAIAVPAFARGQDEVIVTGRNLPGTLITESMRVNYSDLDLSTIAGRSALNYRIYYAADDLCNRVRDPNAAHSVIDACREEAYRDALLRVGTRAERYAPMDTNWVR